MKSKEILAIKRPEDLFPESLDDAKKLYRVFAKTWHPDLSDDPAAERVFAHINSLYEMAINKLGRGYWGFAGGFCFSDHGNMVRVPYFSKEKFELGDLYICENEIIYNFWGRQELREGLKRGLSSFKFGSDKMRKEVERYLPLGATFIDRDIVRIPKKPELVSLRAVLNHFDGSMEPRSVAWILSSLYNLLCYFEFIGIVHHDISPDTYFIDPASHSGVLLGGWWYSQLVGEPIKFIPRRTHATMPFRSKATKKALHLTDASLVLLLGRELLGKELPNVPKPLYNWLTSIATEGAIDNYRETS